MILYKRFLFIFFLFFFSGAFALEMPLKSQVRLILPASVKTVAEASNYFISIHNYKITMSGLSPIESINIFKQTIPLSFPYGEIKTIEEALLALINRDQVLIIDTKEKLISFGYLNNEGGSHD